MLFDINIDTEQDVIDIRKKAMEVLADGGVELGEWNSEGTSVKKVRSMSLQKIIEECNSYLKLLNPSKYGARIKRINPSYTGL